MIGVIFEVLPHTDKKDEYLNIAASLRSELEQIDGFISIERFQSLNDPKKILSLSFYESEAAVDEWRNRTRHRDAQKHGREELFEDYRIRVVSVMRDYGMQERDEAPRQAQPFNKL